MLVFLFNVVVVIIIIERERKITKERKKERLQNGTNDTPIFLEG